MRIRAFLSVLCISLFTASAKAQPQTILYVDDDGNPGTDCTSWEDACPELQTALSLAEAGDQIWVAQGLYRPDYDVNTGQHTGDREASFHLVNGVALYGGFDGTETTLEKRAGLFDETILSGDLLGNDGPDFSNNDENSYHVVFGFNAGSDAMMDGFTATAGNADLNSFAHGHGGGFHCDGGSPTIRNCTFTQNWAGIGGGAFLSRECNAEISFCNFTDNQGSKGAGLGAVQSDAKISHCVFSGNSFASHGAGLYLWESDLTITDSSFVNNVSPIWGGAMYLVGESYPLIQRCLISQNSAGGSGGGVRCTSLTGATFTNCIITQNSAPTGGGAYCTNDRTIFSHCTISNNTAGSGGGALCWANSQATFINCTITGNSGGGIGCTADATPLVKQCAVWNNVGGQLSSSGACELTVRYSDVQGGWPGEGNINADPLWVNPEAQDFHLLPNSPCIDAGDPEYAAEQEEFDIDGEPGVFNERIDIGADEYHDCNGNDVADYLDIAKGTSEDCTANAIADECEPDCNDNGVADSCDIREGVSEDCTDNGIPDECEPDCNNNGVADSCDLDIGTSDDCNENGVPDECIKLENDCNSNGTPDECDTAEGSSADCDGNSIPDECEDTSADCNKNGVWDPCDLADPASDADRDGALDECETPMLLFVDDDAPGDPGPGDPSVSDPAEDGSFSNPYDAIQEAVDHARDVEDGNPGNNYYVDIVLKDGTYNGMGNKDIVLYGRAYLLRSDNGPVGCIIDCQSRGRGFHFGMGESLGTRLKGMTITNGFADDGGAIYCENGSAPLIDGCMIIGNSSTYSGGGIACVSSSPNITNCLISQNVTGSSGGGVSCIFGSEPTISNCAINGNISTSEGGGIHCRMESSAKITNCSISQNVADSSGGGIACYDISNLVISNCVFDNNVSGSSGGAMYYWKSHPKISHCLIIGNAAEVIGGGVACHLSSNSEIRNSLISGNETSGFEGGGVASSNCFGLTISGCTLTGNAAPDGGGLRVWGGYQNVDNSIFRDNTPQDILVGVVGGSHQSEITIHHSNIPGGQEGVEGNYILLWGDGNLDADPLFVDPDNDDFRLSPDSPCIDAADNTAVPSDTTDLDDDGDTDEPIPFDLDGNPRFVDDLDTQDTGLSEDGCPVIDIGAYEFQEGTTECCPADFDGDDSVGASDLAQLLGSWGPCDDCEDCPADFNDDCGVNAADLAQLLGAWGPCD